MECFRTSSSFFNHRISPLTKKYEPPRSVPILFTFGSDKGFYALILLTGFFYCTIPVRYMRIHPEKRVFIDTVSTLRTLEKLSVAPTSAPPIPPGLLPRPPFYRKRGRNHPVNTRARAHPPGKRVNPFNEESSVRALFPLSYRHASYLRISLFPVLVRRPASCGGWTCHWGYSLSHAIVFKAFFSPA